MQVKQSYSMQEAKPMAPPPTSPWWMALVFAAGILAIGMGVSGLAYAYSHGWEKSVINPPPWPPDWFFWAVWIFLYPTLGIATYFVWRERETPLARRALLVFVIHFVANLSWLPIVHLTRSTLAVPVLMDIFVDVFVVWVTVAYGRVSRTALLWLTPYLAWNIFTTIIKIWRLLLNVG